MIKQINEFADNKIKSEVNNPVPEGKQITELKNLKNNIKELSFRIPQKTDSYKRTKSDNKHKDSLLSLFKLLKRFSKEKINNKEPLNMDNYKEMLREKIAFLERKIYCPLSCRNSFLNGYFSRKSMEIYSSERSEYGEIIDIISFLSDGEKGDCLNNEDIKRTESLGANIEKDIFINDKQDDKKNISNTNNVSTKMTSCNYINKEKKNLSPIFNINEYNNLERINQFKIEKTCLGRKKKEEKSKENNAKKDDTDVDNGKIKILRKCGENISKVLCTYIPLIDPKIKIFSKYLLNKNHLKKNDEEDNENLQGFLYLKIIDFIEKASQRNTNEKNKKANFEKIKTIMKSNNKEKELELSILNHFCQMRINKLLEMYIEDNKEIEIQIKGEKKFIELKGLETLKDLKRKVVKDFKDKKSEKYVFEEYPKDIKKKFKNKIEELLKGNKNEINHYNKYNFY